MLTLGLMTFLYFYLPSTHGKEQLRQAIIEQVQPMIDGSFDIEEINGNIFTHLQLKNIKIHTPTESWLEISQLELKWRPTQLLSGNLHIDSFTISEPRLNFKTADDGSLILPFKQQEPVAQPKKESSGDFSNPLTLNIHSLKISRAQIQVQDKNIPLDFEASVHGKDDIGINLDLKYLKSRLQARLKLNILKNLASVETLQLSKLDLKELLVLKNSTGEIDLNFNGTINLNAPNQSQLQGKIDFSKVQIEGIELGNGFLDLSLKEQKLLLSTEAIGSLSKVVGEFEGRLDDQQLKWDVSLEHFNMGKISENLPESSDINMAMVGSLTMQDYQIISFHLETNILDSSAAGIKINKGKVLASGNLSTIDLHECQLNTSSTRLDARAKVSLVQPSSSLFELSLNCRDLSEWETFARTRLSGQLVLQSKGRPSGNSMTIHTQLSSDNLSINEKSTLKDLSFNNNTLLTEGNIQSGELDLKINSFTQSIDVGRSLPIDHIQLQTNFHMTSDKIRVELNQLGWHFQEDHFSLVDKSIITIENQHLKATALTITAGAQSIQLHLNSFHEKTLSMRLKLEKFNPDPWTHQLLNIQDLANDIELQLDVEGQLPIPEAKLAIKISEPKYGHMSMNELVLNGELNKEKTFFQIDLSSQHGSIALLQLNAGSMVDMEMPIEISQIKDLHMTCQVNQLDLSPWAPFAKDYIEKCEGFLNIDLDVKGQWPDLKSNGSFRLSKGLVKEKSTKEVFENILLNSTFKDSTFKLDEFSFSVLNGNVMSQGEVELKKGQLDNFHLALKADQYPVRYQNMLKGTLNANMLLRGGLNDLHMSGNVAIPDCLIKPDLSFLNKGASPRDPTIIVLEEVQKEAKTEAPKPSLMDHFNMKLSISFPQNIRIVHEKLRAECGGKLLLTHAGNTMNLHGDIQIRRGNLTFLGRRFNINKAVAKCQGSIDLPPYMDIQAETKVDNHAITIHILGPSDAPKISFSSSPPLREADILALLTFGRKLDDLGEGEKKSFGQQASQIATSLASSALQQYLREEFEFDEFGIELDRLSEGQIGVGRYLGKNTYLSISQDLRSKGGRDIRVEHEVIKGLKVLTERSGDGANSLDVVIEKNY